MKLKNSFLFLSLCFVSFASAQRIKALSPGLIIDSISSLHTDPTRIVYDPISKHIFYSTINGNIYELDSTKTGLLKDSLRYTVSDHGISTLQGFAIKDSVIYLSGNIWNSTTGIGKIVKGKLNTNGTRTWIAVLTTTPYPTSDPGGDHGFSGITIDPAGKYIYASSGARTHLGEVRTNSGAWPGQREVPVTTRIYKIAADTSGIILQNDSSFVDNSGLVYAWGTRNTYSMAWDANGLLFGADNSGERDDSEELNWLRAGKNYGFPWRMGTNNNPLRSPAYDVEKDLLVNHMSAGYLSGWFSTDANFPKPPANTTFYDPIRNYGPDADFYRDSITGKVRNASDEGIYINSFTPHRSPLGLVIDKDSVLAAPFSGEALMLSFMPGGDSAGYTPLSPWGTSCPFVDPVRDLLHLKLAYNSITDNYDMSAYKIAEGFYLPVDATLVGNYLYVIESGSAGAIWRIKFPAKIDVGIANFNSSINDVNLYPNPANENATLQFYCPKDSNVKIWLSDMFGKSLIMVSDKKYSAGMQSVLLSTANLIPAVYFYHLQTEGGLLVGKIVKQ